MPRSSDTLTNDEYKPRNTQFSKFTKKHQLSPCVLKERDDYLQGS